MKRIFIIAGERSGDLLGSRIISEVKKKNPNIEFLGVGGELMQKEGLTSIFPMEDLSVMGIFEVLPRLFLILRRIRETVKKIIETKPDLVLTIDSPDFCFRVIKKLKKLDKENTIKKVHFVAPSVWAYRKNRAKKISKLYDLLLCLLPFEPPYFEKYGLKTIFIGHPIFDEDYNELGQNIYDFEKKYKINKDDKVITLTPGSRIGEIKRNLPIMIKSVELLSYDYLNLKTFIIAIDKTKSAINSINNKYKFNGIIISQSEKFEAIKSSNVAIAKSGTNTFELLACRVPIIVMYKFNWLTTKIVAFLRKKSDIKYANLINIIANEEVVPEFVLSNTKAELIAPKVREYLENKKISNKQIDKSIEVMKVLGYEDKRSSAEKIANELLKL